ncbi:hypothetical protein [Streptomyces winkii]|uniref:hypothetical protein n=1 Tax=Streptomyces winkii TaxID=3051178 RepID=UPI0028D1BF8B|nr:hypothetical protein [Streptomyces sp. DSM 40971]
MSRATGTGTAGSWSAEGDAKGRTDALRIARRGAPGRELGAHHGAGRTGEPLPAQRGAVP